MSDTQEALTLARQKLEEVENAYYFAGTATQQEVDDARDEYFDAWEERRDAVLEKKARRRLHAEP
jgi:hypothetical protein